ncbi:MAG: hypothetical protein LHV68_03855 [Elusimicrobia bacterium]|nr:hypothetical protein [Candidatus Liberimonas magnetica]
MNKFKNTKGQALIETLLCTVFLIIICFATIQLCIVVIHDLISNEAAFSIARAASVTKDENTLDNRVKTAAAILLLPHFNLNSFVPVKARTESTDIAGRKVYNVTLEYFINTMFAYFIDPLAKDTYSLGSSRFLKRFARARIVKSPDEEFYNKAYPQANEF